MPQEYHELPEQVQRNILACLKVRREQLTNALLMEHYKSQLPTITDFDWRLKVLEAFTLLVYTISLFIESIYFTVGDGIE